MGKQIDGESSSRIERREEEYGVTGAEPKYRLVASNHHKHLRIIKRPTSL